MSKRALLVGINEFVPGHRPLRGCVNDIIEMHSLLREYYGFEQDGIRELRDQDATGQAVLDGLDWLLSDYGGGGKDVRVFHFAGHGTQVLDQDRDELDCYDEAIVPYDHDWDSPIRDDDLRAIFDKIPDGVHFTFVADCCHSGTIQKKLHDEAVDYMPRYLSPPPWVKDEIAVAQARRREEGAQRAAAELDRILAGAGRHERRGRIQWFVERVIDSGEENRFRMVSTDRHVLVAACTARQTAADTMLDGQYRGALSWALGKAITATAGRLTYADLVSSVGTSLAGFGQQPQLECPAAMRDAVVFAPPG